MTTIDLFRMKITMKSVILILAVLFFHTASAYTSPDWSQVEFKKNPRHEMLNFSEKGTDAGLMIVAEQGKWLPPESVDFSVQDGYVTIDTRKLHQQRPNAVVFFKFRNLPMSEILPGKKFFRQLDITSIPEGRQIHFILEGGERVNGKDQHAWLPGTVSISNTASVRIEDYFPQKDFTGLQPVIQLTQAGIYQIGRVTAGAVAERKVAYDPSRNLLINGNAESGFQYVSVPCAPMVKSYDGKSRNYGEQTVSQLPLFSIDENEAHTGKASFRADVTEKPVGAFEFFAFNPVKYLLREPFAFSVWLKSSQDNYPVYLAVRMSTWKAYQTQVRVSKEWKKYTISIPSFGDPAPGVECYAVSQVLKETLRYAFPQVILTEPGTLWIDDAVVQIAGQTAEHPLPVFAIKGKLDRGQSYYFAGEKIRPQLEILPLKQETVAELTWKIVDFSGRTAASGVFGEYSLPHRFSPEIVPPENFRGPGTLSITAAAADGTCVTRNFYFGVISAPAPVSYRMGAHVDSPNKTNTKIQLDMLKDFRIGSIRTWGSQGKGFKGLKETYQGRGFDLMVVMENLSLREPDRNLLYRDYTEFLNDLAPYLKELHGIVGTYELFNEPNIRNPQTGWDSSRYRAFNIESVRDALRIVGRGIHEMDSSVRIAGPTPVPTSPAYIASVLSNGGSTECDIVTEHAYRELPELPDYGEDIANVRNIVRKSGKKMPIWSTESCLEIPVLLPEETIPADIVACAARDIRIPLIGFANGLDRYYHFMTSVLAHPQTTFLDLILGSPETDGMPRPGLYLYAARALIDIIGDAPCVTRAKLGTDVRGYIFDRGDKRVAAVWKWNGEAEKIELPEPFTVYDMMGQKWTCDEVRLSAFPCYIESDLSAPLLRSVLEQSMNRKNTATQCDVSFRVIDPRRIALEIRNPGASAVDGVLDIRGNLLPEKKKSAAVHIPGEDVQTVELELAKPLSGHAQELKLEFQLSGGERFTKVLPVSAVVVPYAAASVTPDGDLSDWPEQVAALKVDYSNHASKDEAGWTDEEKKITGEVRMFWNENSLNMAFILNKEKFQPYTGPRENDFFEGDSIQLAFDTLKNAEPHALELQDDDLVYALAGDEKSPVVIREVTSSPVHDSLVKEVGKTKDVQLGIKTLPGKIVYEAKFSRRSVSPFQLETGNMAGFSAIFNLSNGVKRIGWLEFTPGVGQWPRSAAEYLHIVLSKGDEKK